MDRDFALIIGINDYPEFGADLNGAVRDARDFDAWLIHPKGGDMPPANRVILSSSASPPAPLREEIDKALRELKRKAALVKPRRFYFFFAGHGLAEGPRDVCLCLPTWSPDLPMASLGLNSYVDAILKCMGCEEVIVFLDCCRTPMTGFGGLGTEFGCMRPSTGAGNARVFILHASEYLQAAFEPPESQAVPREQMRGHFTTALLEGLKGAAKVEDDGGITQSNLIDYIDGRLPEIAMEYGQVQKIVPSDGFTRSRPALFGSFREEEVAAHYLIEFPPGRTGLVQLEDSNLSIVKQAYASEGAWDIILKPGWHTFRDMETGAERRMFFAPTLPGEEARHAHF